MRWLAAVAAAVLIVAGGERARATESPPDARWQYQLESRGGEPASGGIDVDLAPLPYWVGRCACGRS
jgi:hypothetical protein